jgi:hypothetical protein
MDETGILILLMYVALGTAGLGWWYWQKKRVDAARKWPPAEATIESGTLEVYSAGRGAKVTLPTFSFSYAVNGDYYSGRFALMPYLTDPAPGITERLIGAKLEITYDPSHPDVWFIPTEYIEGCKVEQKLGPHFTGFYPKD